MGVGNVCDEIADGLKTISLPNLAEDISGAVNQGDNFKKVVNLLSSWYVSPIGKNSKETSWML